MKKNPQNKGKRINKQNEKYTHTQKKLVKNENMILKQKYQVN